MAPAPLGVRYHGVCVHHDARLHVAPRVALGGLVEPLLRVELLGDCSLTYGDQRVTTIATPRLQSLLAYLVLHRDVLQPRQHLAFLFWPDTHEAQARNNLRQLVHQLRRALPAAEGFLHTDASTLCWHSGTPFTLDIAEFERELQLAETAEARGDRRALQAALEQAARLYRGDVLPSCYDDWIVHERERLRLRHLQVLERLAAALAAQGENAAAIGYTRRFVRADPLNEAGYQRLMQLLALHGDRAGALHVYHHCAAILQRELGIEPDPATRAVYERLMRPDPEEVAAVPVVAHAPTFAAMPTLIGRQGEWLSLAAAWRRAIAGAPRFVLITGEAGVGKSRLAEDFLAWAGQQGAVTAKARSYAAEGQLSFAPVTEWLRGNGLRPHAARLDAVWLAEVARIVPELSVGQATPARQDTQPEFGRRQRFFEALARATLAAPPPLLLLLDDLQWCDQETLEWLHYLLRFDQAARLLILGNVRAEELPQQHPLHTLLLHLRATTGLTEIVLQPLSVTDTAKLAAQVAGHPLDLSAAAATQLFHETGGYPLFVVETVRAGLRREALSVPEAGSISPKVVRPLSPRVQAVLAGRLLQLSPGARALAELAAAIGREFTLDLLIVAGNTEADDAVRALDELWHKRIVREHGANAYDFTHDTLRDVAYTEIGVPQRQLLHRRVAQALETLHAEDLDPVRGQIAAHLERAGRAERAIPHYRAAALVAQRVYANEDAITMLSRGLALLEQLPPGARRDTEELSIHLALLTLYRIARGWTSRELAQTLDRALVLCDRVGDDAQRAQILFGLQAHSIVQAQLERVQLVAGEIAVLYQRLNSSAPRLSGMMVAGAYLHLGRASEANEAFTRMLAEHDPHQDQRMRESEGWHFEAHARAWQAHALWYLGFPRTAIDLGVAALQFARDFDEPFNQALAATYLALLRQLSADTTAARTAAEEALALAIEHRAPYYRVWSNILVSYALAWEQPDAERIAHLCAAISGFRATGARLRLPYYLALLAQVYAKAAQATDGLAAIDEAMAEAHAHNEHWWDAELHRLHGELLRASGAGNGDVEAALRHAIETARAQRARALELRATTSLARLLAAHGRSDDARVMLHSLYISFTEGFETPDLHAARVLLAQLA
ncbi:MAG: ATP-binding protein [Thermomicrobiales bacterium]